MNSVAVLLGELIPPVRTHTASRLRPRWVGAWSVGPVTGTRVCGDGRKACGFVWLLQGAVVLFSTARNLSYAFEDVCLYSLLTR